MKLFKTSIIFTMSFLLLIRELHADNIKKLKLCENTIESIETQTDIPNGLLLGIGKAEAIRKIKNKFIIWPWTINHAGKSMFFDTKKQMRNYVFKNLKISFNPFFFIYTSSIFLTKDDPITIPSDIELIFFASTAFLIPNPAITGKFVNLLIT